MGHSAFLEPVALRSASVPVRPYVDPEYFVAERERVFRRCWLNIARSDELPERGSYLVRELEVLDTQVLLVHGEDDRIRAFHNICVHRGNRRVGKGLACQRGTQQHRLSRRDIVGMR